MTPAGPVSSPVGRSKDDENTLGGTEFFKITSDVPNVKHLDVCDIERIANDDHHATDPENNLSDNIVRPDYSGARVTTKMDPLSN